MLGWTTLDVKNIHLVVHHKDKLFKVWDYPRNFGNAAKEGWKRKTHWAVYFFYKFKFLVSCTRTCHDPIGHTRHKSNSQSLPPVPMAPRACRRWETRHKQRWQEQLPRRTSIRDWFSQAKRSASNALNWGAPRKQRETRRRRRWNIWLVIMAIFHLWNERLIFTSEDVPAAEEIFASAAELYSVNSSLSSFLWNYGMAVTFCV